MPEATRLPVPESDRRELRSWLRVGTTRKSHAERARIVLLSAEGLSAEAVAAQWLCWTTENRDEDRGIDLTRKLAAVFCAARATKETREWPPPSASTIRQARAA
jgi:hypothetical protein